MTPSLEAVLFASPTISLNVNMLSNGLDEKDLMFRNKAMNGVILFKFPNFDTTEDHSAGIPGMDLYGPKRTTMPVRTGIFVPKDRADLPLGGYGIYLDDKKSSEYLIRHLGLSEKEEAYQNDFRIMHLLEAMPSLDPFILQTSFKQHGVEVHPRYVSIVDEQVAQIRAIIAEKVKPIIAKALGIADQSALEVKAKRFIDAIWDPTMGEAGVFITAFGIKPDDAPATFSAWKGVTFFQHEFSRGQSDLSKMTAWLDSPDSLPLDYRRLGQGEKQQITMFRDSVRAKVRKVMRNVNMLFGAYEQSYQEFIMLNNPKQFRDFLFKAESYYWTLGACNGVLAQVCGTWKRYCFSNGQKRPLNFDLLERLYKVCDSILKSREGDNNAVG